MAFSAPAAPAQLDAPDAMPPPVAVKFAVVGWDCHASDVFYQGGGKEHRLDIPIFQRSEDYDYSGDPSLVFYRRAAAAPGQPPESTEVGRVVIPPRATRLLLLFSRGANGSYRIRPLPDDDKSSPAGQARVFNASPYLLAIKSGANTVMLPPGEPAFLSGAGGVIPMQVARRCDDRWALVLTHTLTCAADEHLTVFFTHTDSPVFRFIGRDGKLGPVASLQMFILSR